jgi:hypothetical protein
MWELVTWLAPPAGEGEEWGQFCNQEEGGLVEGRENGKEKNRRRRKKRTRRKRGRRKRKKRKMRKKRR